MRTVRNSFISDILKRFVQRCLRKPVVNPVEDEAIVEAASSRNLPHTADEEDRVEGQLQQPGKFLHVLPMLPSLDGPRGCLSLGVVLLLLRLPRPPIQCLGRRPCSPLPP
ncbi:unnamed protein product [Heligmosomoides polygyrus]|uniref:Uncharacterized protein n=1 Tax=Heligmosomoides polygyrus TaxID=6339 RepID=A0A183FBQ8_HELPZ|nr:unnamed protein product [Heligmosomoides polygyrus]